MRSRWLPRSLRAGGIIAAVCALGTIAAPTARRVGEQYALANAIRDAADRPGRFPARVIAPGRAALAALSPASQESVGFAIAAALEEASKDPSPAVQHSAGLASLMSGQAAEATRYLSHAAKTGDDPAHWTNFGAALYALGLERKDNEHVLASLGAFHRALSAESARAEAAYNFALAVEQLGVRPSALELWKKYLALDDSDAWRAEARRHVVGLSQTKSATAVWSEAATRGDVDALAQLTSVHPQQARSWTESDGLANWAFAARQSNRSQARRSLTEARAIGKALQTATGESLVANAVRAIDDALNAHDDVAIEALIDGHLRYSNGRALYRQGQLSAARAELERAETSFLAGRSPMNALAGAYVASIHHDANRLPAARALLDSLLRAEEGGESKHYALRAQLHYQVARLEALRGFWSDSLAASTKALALYHRIREKGNEGMAALLVAETYDFIGLPAVAARYGVEAIRLLSDAGDVFRLRVATANLCRSSMRRGMWDAARALVGVERSLERLRPDPVLTSDTSMRAAIIEENTGNPSLAGQLLRRAEAEAALLSDEGYRASTFAELHGASGALMRRRDPAMAVSLLSKAITHQEQQGRAVLLPQLYLERGRAHRDLRETKKAAADFEMGIGLLERQRLNLYDPGMRYGIFDDSHELFTEAMSLHLAAGEQSAAFAILERGRARALIEQISGFPAKKSRPIDLSSAQRSMPPGTLLVEYAALPDRLLLFLVARDLADVRQVRIDPGALTAKTAALVSAMVERRPLSEVENLSADLYALLIEPVRERRNYSQLVLVPDAAMQQIPFGALYDRRSRAFLVEQHLLVGAPSAAVYFESRSRWSRVPKTPPKTAAVFVAASADRSLGLRRLPDAPREAQAIAAIYPQPMLFQDAEASAQRFIDSGADADVAHFAGHALIDPADPAQSALVFTSASDQLLACRRIGKTDFRRARIVVLAACSTMVGRVGHAEGTPSIARSFLAAGVPNVIGTLWDVEDADATALIADFHEKLAGGASPAAALRDSQISALHSGHPAMRHPGSWAAFALLGAGGL